MLGEEYGSRLDRNGRTGVRFGTDSGMMEQRPPEPFQPLFGTQHGEVVRGESPDTSPKSTFDEVPRNHSMI